MPARILIVLLLAVTACTSGTSSSTPAPTRSAASGAAASPSGTPSSPVPAASPPPARSVVLAFAGGVGGLALYSLAPGSHAAALVRRLAGPSGMHVAHVSLSGGSQPTVCAVWTVEPGDDRPAELRCYRRGATEGRTVARGHFDGVGVRPDGRAVAWTEQASNGVLVVADLAGDVATVRSRQR